MWTSSCNPLPTILDSPYAESDCEKCKASICDECASQTLASPFRTLIPVILPSARRVLDTSQLGCEGNRTVMSGHRLFSLEYIKSLTRSDLP
ncbi:hypothetical protein M378DRAFT_621625 [Amanita muscaria Koide BX008]|uniref:Uncharacterized protein n=1 Tax=Amanita muscaria (strain Koide BX008) TaxID=946122 RepID=A0A0C2T3F2_AMAMK|nr:hypothetical protein M378DRAFT_621625 [Amanita muscaria Koide BX008]